MWARIVGKIRPAYAPLLKHWWPVTLYVSARGLTTSAIPYGNRVCGIEFDFCDAEAAQLFWQQLVACTRFSGHSAPHSSRRRSQLWQLGDGRGLFPRVGQLRLLAGRW